MRMLLLLQFCYAAAVADTASLVQVRRVLVDNNLVDASELKKMEKVRCQCCC